MTQHVGFCPKCLLIKTLTEHHVYPKRFFGKKNNKSKLLLCEECHREIEKILPEHFKLTKLDYQNIHRSWLSGKNPIVAIKGGRYEMCQMRGAYT